ncbi:MAG: exodeoxyribonuclease VII small subunit [Clostridia bacterium]|nr:exodeoxyribonuclease VII small subunit [Clostridia bacterium]
MAPRKPKTLSFEEGLERLEAIAEQMERGELPLDELMKLYEEGVKLSGELNQKLQAADSRMKEVRLGRDGEPQVVASDIEQQQTMLDALTEE